MCTDITMTRLVQVVSSHVTCMHSSKMFLKMMLEKESPSTLRTLVGPQSSVNQGMFAHVADTAEAFATCWAGMGSGLRAPPSAPTSCCCQR